MFQIFIQRSLGCDHMTCSRCDTSFCYRCGENYRGFKLLGNHFSRLSPFGCRYNFMPDAPHLRRLIRGAVLGNLTGDGVAQLIEHHSSDSRSKDRRFEPCLCQEHKTNFGEFFQVKKVVLAHCWCDQPLCVYTRIRMITYAR